MKWLALLIWDPREALDWHNEKGNGHDHAKIVADIVVFSILTCLLYVSFTRGTFPPVAWGITLIAGAMGSRVFMAFLRSRTVTTTETITGSLHGIAAAPLTRPIDSPDAGK